APTPTLISLLFCFLLADTAATRPSPLSLHDALPISTSSPRTRTTSRRRWAGRYDRAGYCAGPECCPARGWSSTSKLRSTAGRWKIGRAHVNSSHVKISYAVFCLKKKKAQPTPNDKNC